MRAITNSMVQKQLSDRESARLEGGIVGGTEATPGEFPYQRSGNRIVGGEDADINEYPWQG